MIFDPKNPQVGQTVLPVHRSADAVELFRFSAATWNAHRIHFDPEFARSEGLPGSVVQAHLHGAWLAQVARTVAGPGARLQRLAWSNRAPVAAGEMVTVNAIVAAVDETDGVPSVTMDLVESNAAGAKCVTGSATVVLGVQG